MNNSIIYRPLTATRVYEEKSVNKNFYDNSWLVSI